MTYSKCFTKLYTASMSADRFHCKVSLELPLLYISEDNRPNLNASNSVSRLDVAALTARREGGLFFVKVAEIGGLLLMKYVILHHVLQIAK